MKKTRGRIPHPDDLFRWPCGTIATRRDIERGDYDWKSDDFIRLPEGYDPDGAGEGT